MRKCNCSLLKKCPLFEKTHILPSLDAHNTFWLKSFYYCYGAEATAPEKLNNLATRSLPSQFATNLHETYMHYLYSEIEYYVT